MKLLKKEDKLIVVDSYLEPFSRRLKPGEICKPIGDNYPGNLYDLVALEDSNPVNEGIMHDPREVTVQRIVTGEITKERRGAIYPVEAIRNGTQQEVKSKPRYPFGKDSRLSVFLPTFTHSEQLSMPCLLKPRFQNSELATNGRHYWVYKDAVYSTSMNLKAEEVKALITEAEDRVNAKVARTLERAQRKEKGEGGSRLPIPDDVKMFVWQRDGGCCVKCGSNQNLEFDHIIPVVMGGANTARNLQLLCEPCNRAKGGSLV
jgi:5-methylcytosine-specific restriction endonuclease McrA